MRAITYRTPRPRQGVFDWVEAGETAHATELKTHAETGTAKVYVSRHTANTAAARVRLSYDKPEAMIPPC